jgi:Mg2+-importing ATPase
LVIRDGKQTEIPVTEVVPGNLVVLSAGDMSPADGRTLEAHDFFVKQALLNGESYPVEKRASELAATATDIQDAANAVFMGTTVISGSARVRVVNTGAGTAIGAIADVLTRQPPPRSARIASAYSSCA